jgi:radical SAM protein with 4Fe4S-binding SPASM domain
MVVDNKDPINYKKFIFENSIYIFDPSDLEVIKVFDNTNIDELCRNIIKNKRSKNESSKRNIVKENTNSYKKNNIDVVSLDLAHGCTLKCTYCYLTAGNLPKRKLTKEKFLEILDFLSDNKNHKITFYFAGEGEPTINFELLKQIPTLCREHGFKECTFEITTNGTLLTQEIIDFFEKENFAVSVSLDGDKLNDQNRVFPNGRPSFDLVFDKIMQIKQSKIRFACKSVVAPENQNLLRMSKFFDDNKIPFYIGFATRSFNGEYIPKIEDVKILEKQLDILCDYYKKRISANQCVYSLKIVKDLQRIYYRITTVEGCNAAKNSFFIDMNGDIYSCSSLNSRKDLSVGNIKTGIDYEKIKAFSYYPKKVNEYSLCKSCWMRYLCSGSCIAEKWLESGDTNVPSKYLCAVNNVYWTAIIKLYISIYPYIDGNINFKRTPFVGGDSIYET